MTSLLDRCVAQRAAEQCAAVEPERKPGPRPEPVARRRECRCGCGAWFYVPARGSGRPRQYVNPEHRTAMIRRTLRLSELRRSLRKAEARVAYCRRELGIA